MRTITTSKGKTYPVDYAFGPTFDGAFSMQLRDSRRIPELVEEFDGLENIHYSDSDTGERDFPGYSELISIRRGNGDIVRIQLAKG